MGSRKAIQTTRTQLILLAGFAIAVATGADVSMFTAFVGGCAAAQGAFVWGNVGEWKAKGGKDITWRGDDAAGKGAT